jgi:hypothetical protein
VVSNSVPNAQPRHQAERLQPSTASRMKRPKNQDAHCQLQRRQVPQNLFEFKTILEEQSFEDSQPGERFNIRSEALQPRKLFATPFLQDLVLPSHSFQSEIESYHSLYSDWLFGQAAAKAEFPLPCPAHKAGDLIVIEQRGFGPNRPFIHSRQPFSVELLNDLPSVLLHSFRPPSISIPCRPSAAMDVPIPTHQDLRLRSCTECRRRKQKVGDTLIKLS